MENESPAQQGCLKVKIEGGVATLTLNRPDRRNSLSPELIDALAAQGVRLIGIDTPSVDPASDAALPSHAALARNDLAVLEGVVLGHVPEVLYTLIALPLKLAGSDASPVRAALLSAD